MNAMPDAQLKKFFGVSKSSLKNQDKGNTASPTGKPLEPADSQHRLPNKLPGGNIASTRGDSGASSMLPSTHAARSTSTTDPDNVPTTSIQKTSLKKEEPVGGQRPAVPLGTQQTQVPQGSVQARKANTAQFSQFDLETKLSQLPLMLNYDTAISTLSDIVKDKSQDLVRLRKVLESEVNSSPLDAEQKKLLGNLLGVLTSVANQRTQMSSKKKSGFRLKEESELDPKKKDQDPNVDVEEEPGLETSSEDETAEAPINKSEEALAFSRNLKGHTIKTADIEVKPDGGLITLDLASVSTPVEIAWNKEGKVVFSFKGRPYFIKK